MSAVGEKEASCSYLSMGHLQTDIAVLLPVVVLTSRKDAEKSGREQKIAIKITCKPKIHCRETSYKSLRC